MDPEGTGAPVVGLMIFVAVMTGLGLAGYFFGAESRDGRDWASSAGEQRGVPEFVPEVAALERRFVRVSYHSRAGDCVQQS